MPRLLASVPPLYWLLAFMPVSFALEFAHASPTWTFVASCAAILPLAGLLGETTERLTEYTGATLGGLLNATSTLVRDGETNWFEGSQLVATSCVDCLWPQATSHEPQADAPAASQRE